MANGQPPICSLDPRNPVHCNQTCESPYGFNLTYLQLFVQNLYHWCPYDRCLARLPNGTVRIPPVLTVDATINITGADAARYSYVDFYNRLATWKVPLLQAAALFPRPPLGTDVEIFVVMRLLGNPIGTLQDIILKFASCEGRALYWKHQFRLRKYTRLFIQRDQNGGTFSDFNTYERFWKAFTIIVDSCDEWGRDKGDYTQGALTELLKELISIQDKARKGHDKKRVVRIREECVKSCLRTAGALAADRSTKIFPIAVALALFLFVIVIAFVRTASAGVDSTTVLINVESYSVAFSALFFWILSLVQLGGAIGSSQTENAIARILNRLQREINSILDTEHVANISQNDKPRVRLLDSIREEEGNTSRWRRKTHGGIYSWQPIHWTSIRDRWKGRSNPQLDRIRYDVARSYGRNHTPPFFPSFPQTLFPNPNELCRDRDWSGWVVLLIKTQCFIVALVFWILRFLLWLAWIVIAAVSFVFGPWVPGSPVFPFFAIFSGIFAAWTITLRVPPGHNMSCRPAWQAYIFLAWWISWMLDNLTVRTSHVIRISRKLGVRKQSTNEWANERDEAKREDREHLLRFWTSLAKDSLVVVWVFWDVIWTQYGVLNKAGCYIDASNTYIVLPLSPDVQDILGFRLWREYFTYTLLLMLLHLVVIPTIVGWHFFEALQVFVQRDDMKPNGFKRQIIRKQYKPWGVQEGQTFSHGAYDPYKRMFVRWWRGMASSANYVPEDPMPRNERVEFRQNVRILVTHAEAHSNRKASVLARSIREIPSGRDHQGSIDGKGTGGFTTANQTDDPGPSTLLIIPDMVAQNSSRASGSMVNSPTSAVSRRPTGELEKGR